MGVFLSKDGLKPPPPQALAYHAAERNAVIIHSEHSSTTHALPRDYGPNPVDLKENRYCQQLAEQQEQYSRDRRNNVLRDRTNRLKLTASSSGIQTQNGKLRTRKFVHSDVKHDTDQEKRINVVTLSCTNTDTPNEYLKSYLY
mmetsp:Transcript_14943/g.20941  ORF Transcript_14943/g.20941 Transcript_14943/m.20941 type:complete len:143 (-) Transcript_14943:1724-2152(-)